MAYEKKPGDIAIFKNTKKEKDTQPDYQIVGLGLDGEKIKGALWLKKDRNGNTFMAGKIEPDTFQSAGYGSSSNQGDNQRVSGGGGQSQGSYDLNDDIPFISNGFCAFDG